MGLIFISEIWKILSIVILEQIHLMSKVLIYKSHNSKRYHEKKFSNLAFPHNFMGLRHKLKLKAIQITIFKVFLFTFMPVKQYRIIFYKEGRSTVNK